MFALNPQLDQDSHWVCDLTLCEVRLHKNGHFPWVILIPKKPDLVEITDLSPAEYTQWSLDVYHTTKICKDLFKADKMNIASLGNVVSQLHTHVIARYRDDIAWPSPVFAAAHCEYDDALLERRISLLQLALV